MIRRFLIGCIHFYQHHFHHPPTCRFYPTCSQYAEEALAVHGALWGSVLSIWRVLRCNPFGKGGFDPVPPKRQKSR